MPVPPQSVVEEIDIVFETKLISAIKMAKEALVLKISAGDDSTPCKLQISL